MLTLLVLATSPIWARALGYKRKHPVSRNPEPTAEPDDMDNMPWAHLGDET